MVALLGLVPMLAACRGPTPDSDPPPGASVLRVATSGDYEPFSRSASGVDPHSGDAEWGASLEGFDIAVARAYARDRGLAIRWVHFRWPQLLDDLAAGRFDVAMSGITMRPERSLAGAFTVPVARSGAMLLLPGPPPRDPRALDHPGSVLAVNAGGHLERVTRQHFPRATVRAIADNGQVLAQLDDPEVDAVVTDTLEAPHWLAARGGLRPVGPFTQDRKAYLVAPERPALAADLDRWLLEREADGTLQRLRASKLGPGGPGRTAEPLPALHAAVDERLALMRAVAEDKQRRGLAIEDRAREERVIAAGLASAAAHRPLPPELREAVAHFFRVQIEAAKDVQRAVLAEGAAPPSEGPDLEDDLRPALLRIGARIGRLLAELPGSAAPDPRIAIAPGPLLSPSRARQLEAALEAVRSAASAPK